MCRTFAENIVKISMHLKIIVRLMFITILYIFSSYYNVCTSSATIHAVTYICNGIVEESLLSSQDHYSFRGDRNDIVFDRQFHYV